MDIEKTIRFTGEAAKLVSRLVVGAGTGAVTKAFTTSMKPYAPKMNKWFGRAAFAVGEAVLISLVSHASTTYVDKMIDETVENLQEATIMIRGKGVRPVGDKKKA